MDNPTEIGELASLKSLEDLAIAGGGKKALVSFEGLQSLQALTSLKTLRIAGYANEPWPEVNSWLPQARLSSVSDGTIEACLRAIEALRQSNPGLVFEDHAEGLGGSSPGHWDLLSDYDTPEGIENWVKAQPWLPPAMRPVVTGGIENLKW